MTRLSLLMGTFMATSVTAIIVLLAAISNVGTETIVYRGTIVFILFGVLGCIIGSFLEIILMPEAIETENIKLTKELKLDNDELSKEIGDLLDDENGPDTTNSKYFGTSTDENSKKNNSGRENSKNMLTSDSSSTVTS